MWRNSFTLLALLCGGFFGSCGSRGFSASEPAPPAPAPLTFKDAPAGPREKAGQAFDRANRLYEQGQYTNALAAYDELLGSGRVSAAIYFNRGNVCFKAGQIGRAILNYRLAQRLAPRDADILANLQFARGSVPGAGPRKETRWQQWSRRVALDEATLAVVGAAWVWLGLLAARQVWPQTRRGLRGLTALAGASVGLTAIWLLATLYDRTRTTTAIVVARDAVVRYGPLEESQSYYTARDGMELTVLDEKAGWLQVVDANQRVGWVEARHVAVLPSELSHGDSQTARGPATKSGAAGGN
jgi:tetratricopeptide (TPR) repeat protein